MKSTDEYISLGKLVEKSKYDSSYRFAFERRLKNLVQIPMLIGIDNVKLCCNLGYIKNFIKEIEKEYKAVDFSNSINKEVLLLDSFNSATIEGAKTTIESVKSSINRVSKSKDDIMVLNIFKAMNYMMSAYGISEQILLNEWKIIVNGVCENVNKRGLKYRSGMVYIGNDTSIVHTPEKPENIERCMCSLFRFLSSDMNTLLKSAIAHFYLVYIHPFCDGNGRLARLLMQEVLYKGGYSNFIKVPIISEINKRIRGYYKSIKESEDIFSSHADKKISERKIIDITPAIVYILNILFSSLKEYSKNEVKLSCLEGKIIQKMQKWGVGSEVTVKKVSEIFNVQENTARESLNSLSNKGYLFKYKSGNKNIYRLYQ